MKWGPKEDSFIIEDTQKFTKVLPVYFKTKNFASFVRQLNMYGFHKVKNDRGVHEFRHPSFKKGHYDDLAHIKRKNIANVKDGEGMEKELDADKYNKLRDTLDRTKSSLETITQQNINLIAANKDVASKLYNFKHDYESRLKKLFFMFYFLINSKDEKLLNLLKKTLIELGVAFDGDKNKNYEEQTSEVIEHINRKILVSSNSEQVVISKLLNTFTEYITSNEYFSDGFNLHPLEMGADDRFDANDEAGFEFQFVNSPRKSIQSLNINLKSETVSECDFSGHNSIMMQKSPLIRFDMFEPHSKANEFDLERLMVPIADTAEDNERHKPMNGASQSFKKRPVYDI